MFVLAMLIFVYFTYMCHYPTI